MEHVENLPNPDSPLPLYYQIKQIFYEKIRSGEWEPGQLIPTEVELIRLYNVSRTTIREGINALVREGKLQKKQGRGTVVCSPRMEERLGRLTGFAEEMLLKGIQPKAQLLTVQQITADDEVSEKLLKGRIGDILFIKRIRLGNEEPIAIERSYWPIEVGRLFRDKDLNTMAFYDELEKNGVLLKDADENITARTALEEDAELLQIEIGSPLLRMERITYSTGGQPVEFACTDYRADRYFYRVHLKR